jgi:hypothetical protein
MKIRLVYYLPTVLQQLSSYSNYYHATCHDLSLGLATKTKAWANAGKERNPIIIFTLPRVQENVKELAHTLPSGFPLWKLES